MKKILILAALAVAASAACTKNTLDTESMPKQKISFEVASYVPQNQKLTKAALGSGSSLWDEFASPSFQTSAYFYPTTGTGGQVYMNNVVISPYQSDDATAATSKDNTSIWRAADEYLWPKTGHLNFFSYASKNAVTATSEAATGETRTIGFGTAAAPLTIASDDNILLADACYNAKQSNAGSDQDTITGVEESGANVPKGVPTLFHHLLMKAKFQIQLKSAKKHATTRYEVDILEASITDGAASPTSGIVNNGYLSLTSNAPSGSDLEIVAWTYGTPAVWSAASSPSKEAVIALTATEAASPLTLAVSATAVEHTSPTTHTLLDFRTFMPQVLGADVKFAMTYKLRAYHGNTLYMEETETITPVALKDYTDGGSGKWQMNESWLYTIYLDPVTTAITFDPAVVAWTDKTATDINL